MDFIQGLTLNEFKTTAYYHISEDSEFAKMPILGKRAGFTKASIK